MIDRNYNRVDAIIEIATLYYIDGKKQQEIADIFSTTRSNIAKILKQAVAQGIVKIQIVNPSSNIVNLSRRMVEKFPIKKAIIAPTGIDYKETLSSVGYAAAKYLQQNLKDELNIGIGWGTTLYQMVDQFIDSSVKNGSVVQMHGGMGARDLVVDGYELASSLARKMHTPAYYISAPLIVQSKEAKEILMNDKSISGALKLGRSVDIAFMGIGTTEPELNALLRAGLIDKNTANFLINQGAVGMICGQFFDIAGNLIDNEINDCIIGIKASELKSLKNVIGLACGEKKVEALLGAINGGFLDVVITDEQVAKKLLEK